jgi:hypothetical protein
MNLNMTLQQMLDSKDAAIRRIGERTASELQAAQSGPSNPRVTTQQSHANAQSDELDEVSGHAMLDKVIVLYRGEAPNASAKGAGLDDNDRAMLDRAIAPHRRQA